MARFRQWVSGVRAGLDQDGGPMTPRSFRPLPEDPSGETIAAMFDARSQDWILAAPGDYQTGAAEAFRADGSNLQRVVLLEWPGRRNHTDEGVTVRLMMAPEDALGLADVLAHTARWMLGIRATP